MNTSEWLKTHKQEAMIGGGGIVVAIALYVRSKKNAAASSSSGQPVTNPTYAYPTSTGDTTGYDIYNGLESQVLGLQQAVLGLSTQGVNPGGAMQPATPSPPSTPTAAPPNPYTGEVQQGSGFWIPGDFNPIPGLGGGEFVNLPSGGGPSSPAGSYGGQEYFQPAPGVFTPWTNPTQVGPGTPIFAKTG